MNFWQQNGISLPASWGAGPEPEPVDVAALTADEYADHRADLGTSADAFGESHWTREGRAWQPPREQTAMDAYAQERGQFVREAPDSSAMANMKETRDAQWAAVSEQSFRNRSTS